MQIFGAGIRAGRALHLISEKQAPIRLTCWAGPGGSAQIKIGDAVLISPGVRISAADRIEIGDGCMFGRESSLTDCDWHGIYDRTDVFGQVVPVSLAENVWVGERAFIGKGVKIEKNAVIGAGAVVTKNVPANRVVAGNPAKIVAEIDPEKIFRTRMDMFADYEEVDRYFDRAYRDLLAGNNLLSYLKSLWFP